MINPFKEGDVKQFEVVVNQNDFACFQDGVVHEVYSTFALTRDAEWSGRLFVLEMKEAEEEGIGTFISVEHISPAFLGDKVSFISTFDEITERDEIKTQFKARVGERLIAQGVQKQRILTKAKIRLIFDKHQV